MNKPWLSIIGLGEGGLNALPSATRRIIEQAEVIFGGKRHLHLAEAGERGRPWPVPFSLSEVLLRRGQPTVVLASGDPFFYGVGTSLAKVLAPEEWVSYPSPSTAALMASELGWPLEEVQWFGVHGRDRRDPHAPQTVDASRVFAPLMPSLYPGQRIMCLVRDTQAIRALGEWLSARGFGASSLWVMESLGGPNQRVTQQLAGRVCLDNREGPVAVAVALVGEGVSMSPGRPESAFAHDGQISKANIRAITVSALQPQPHEVLWDIGAGSGAVGIEWCLAGGGQGISIEVRPERVKNIQKNLERYGLGTRMQVVEGTALDALSGLVSPHSIFVGGGMSEGLFSQIRQNAKSGTRLVVNSVCVETEALLIALHAKYGGEMYQFAHCVLAPLGAKHGWVPARPIVQWRTTLS